LRVNYMPYVVVPPATPEDLASAAERRWSAVLEARPELGPAIELQRRLIRLVISLEQGIESGRLPRLSLPPKYLAAKLARGVPVLAGEPIPVPVGILSRTLLRMCTELADGGAGETALRIRSAVERGELDAASLLSASLARDQTAIRTVATHRGLAPDLVWLVAELAIGPFAFAMRRALFDSRAPGRAIPESGDDVVGSALDRWTQGYCPACGSWPAMAEVVAGHRTLRCSLCAGAWELPTYACVYCAEDGVPFVTAAPDEERKDRRLELCSGCGSYLKTVDVETLSAFPLLAIGDLETMDLDVAAMEHGYARPAVKDFARTVKH
jgi:FdhE protein